MARNFKINGAKNIFVFISGVIFCMFMQSLIKYTENELIMGCPVKQCNNMKVITFRENPQAGNDPLAGSDQKAGNSSFKYNRYDPGATEKYTDMLNDVTDEARSPLQVTTSVDIENTKSQDDVQENNTKQYRLVIVVMSSPLHFRNRRIIRQTWALNKPNNTLVYFAIGTEHMSRNVLMVLTKEKTDYGDLLLLKDFKESYYSLTQKLLLVMKWVNDQSLTDYFMKVDEDTFVRIDEVLKALNSKPKESLYWGFFSGAAPVLTEGKWAEHNYFLCDNYLPYAVGGGYVLSFDLVQYVAENSHRFLVFKNEDVALGTWLAPLNISRVHDPNFNTQWISRGCYNSYIVSHSHTAGEIVLLNASLNKTGKLCRKEWRYYRSYMYDWTVPPYKCCKKNNSSIP